MARLLLTAVLLVPTLAASRAHAAEAGRSGCPDPAAAASQPTPTGTRVAGPSSLGPLVANADDVAASVGNKVSSVSGGDLSVALPADRKGGGDVAVDDSGNVYVAKLFSVVKLSPSGQQLWSRSVSAPLRSIYLLGKGETMRVGGVYRDRLTSQTWRPDGSTAGEAEVYGDYFTRSADGGVVAIDRGRYVRIFSAGGSLLKTIGYSRTDNDPSPAAAPGQFYQLGGAALLPDGRLLAADTQHGLMLFTKDGLLTGAIAPDVLDSAGLTQLASPVVRDGYVYLATGPRFSGAQYVTRYRLGDVLAAAERGQAGEDPRLGIGAGLTVNGTDGYVKAGESVDVRAVFDPSWGDVAANLQLCFTVSTADELRAQTRGATKWLPVSAMVGNSLGSALPLPQNLKPGAYQIDARLVRDGEAVSSTSRIFTVGAAGQRLDIAGLPAGADYGGPAPARSVALADQLGTGMSRVQLNLSRMLPNGTTGALDASPYVAQLAAAAKEATERGVTLVVQVAEGSPVDKQLVADGTWARRVGEVVNALKGSVHHWEAWNEPNNTYGSAAGYVKDVLVPFHAAVKAADPEATVIGGSTVGVSLGYWNEIVRVGGLAALDVAGVHPYTGHNRSWEEDGTIEQLTQLRALLVKDGKKIRIWNTEHAWWSDGPFNILAQADNSSRAMLWMAALGIDKWAYFIPEGGWGNDGVTFSAIEKGNYVKPAALALMTTRAQLRDRPFLGRVEVGAPSAYALRFGPRADDAAGGELLVAWTDGLALPALITPDVPGRTIDRTEALGASSPLTLRGPKSVLLDSSPTFLALRGAGRLEVAPQESFGKNLAAAKAGASATASSALSSNPARSAIDDDAGAAGGGDVPGLPMWASSPDDAAPVLTVSFASAAPVDRILVATHSLGSVVTGLRDYDVQVQLSDGGKWTTVAQLRGQFQHRQNVIQIDSQVVGAVRIKALGYNFSGYANGAKPSWWPTGDNGKAIVAEVRAYAQGAVIEGDEAVVPEVPSSGPVVAEGTDTRNLEASTPSTLPQSALPAASTEQLSPALTAPARAAAVRTASPKLTQSLTQASANHARAAAAVRMTKALLQKARLSRKMADARARAAAKAIATTRGKARRRAQALATVQRERAGRLGARAARARVKAVVAAREYDKATARLVQLRLQAADTDPT